MARVRPASHYREIVTPLRQLAEGSKLQIAKDIRAALEQLPESLPKNAYEYASRGDVQALVSAMDWTHFRGVLRGTFTTIGKAREAGALLGQRQINEAFQRAGRRVRYRKVQPKMLFGKPQFPVLIDMERVLKDAGDEYTFDIYAPDVQDEIRQAQDDLIVGLESEARDTIEQVILAGVRAGNSPEDVADDIRTVIGLTDRQAQAVLNYRSMLENLDSGALNRQLRNVLEDATVQAAIDADEELDSDTIDKLVDDYADNYLDYRASTIADTESTRAVNSGLQDAYSQAIDRGVFPSDAVRQFWKVDLDEVTCPVCLSIPDRNPDGVAIDESFDSIEGPQDAPPIHPNCRCDIQIVTDLDKVPEEDS